MSKDLRSATMLAALAAIGGIFPTEIGPEFAVNDLYIRAYKGWLAAGLTPEQAAYKVCLGHPVASNLSANKRREWQYKLIKFTEEENRE